MPEAGATGSVAGRVQADGPQSAGRLLKAAREREGLHLAVLAATIKVSPAKLEALEQDRIGDLPNATFARALAQSVCRSLKIDPRPVLALLPQVETPPLEGAMGSLNAPFQDRPARADGNGLAWASKPMFWTGGLLLLAAVVVGLLPPDLLDGWRTPAVVPATVASAPAAAASVPAGLAEAASAAVVAAASASEGALAAVADTAASAASAVAGVLAGGPAAVPASAPTAAAPAAASAPAAPPAPPLARAEPATPAATAPAPPSDGAPPLGLVSFKATAPSWVEVLDAQGRPVFERLLRAGEVASLDATPPLRVRVGNAGATVLTFRGQLQDLAPYTRNNVARLELR